MTETAALRDELFDTREAAEILRQSEAALRQLRYLGKGPRYVKHGRRVLYRASDIREYLEANVHG
ncbi:helix-turn-helix domain-containing protein [Rhodococcus sp. CSLK01-03]|uniref:Helix-turn-helix domain-containing protein n=1 Tax=Rhodococcus indonesiensis TaxID=3055869 RepID=A0ABT7RSW1_9NOCA|nr:helix-turn-helix domain-containing protein [Rhodococcus indonesiensis]MDM7490738.1 helix-turn-helix domain-containing protein [Rhodococcus indonesiensis]